MTSESQRGDICCCWGFCINSAAVGTVLGANGMHVMPFEYAGMYSDYGMNAIRLKCSHNLISKTEIATVTVVYDQDLATVSLLDHQIWSI